MMWLLSLSCTTETVSVYRTVEQQDVTGREEDTAYLSEVESAELPTLEEVEGILQTGIEQVRVTRVGRLLDVYDEMLAQVDADCPRFTNPDGLYWADTCTSKEYIFRDLRRVIHEMIRCQTITAICLQVVGSCEGMLSKDDTSLQCVGGINELTGVDANGHDVTAIQTLCFDRGQPLLISDLEMWASMPTYKAIYQNGVQIVRDGESVLGAVG